MDGFGTLFGFLVGPWDRYSVSGELGVKRLGCDQIDRMANPSVISAMPKIIRILQLLNS
jgi:hypothetical protein